MTPINLTMVCEAADWHLGTAIMELQRTLCRDDAEAFANFAFADFANEYIAASQPLHAEEGPPAEDHVTDAQWERLEAGPAGTWVIT